MCYSEMNGVLENLTGRSINPAGGDPIDETAKTIAGVSR